MAGYVVKHTRDKIKSIGHTMQETLLHGLDELCSSHHPHNYSKDESEQWINSVDRGGLVHVTHDSFMIFHSMEMELRQHFNKQRVVDMQDEFRAHVKESIVADVDVHFYMDRAAEDLEMEEKVELLGHLHCCARFCISALTVGIIQANTKKRHYKNLVVFTRLYTGLLRKMKYSHQ